MTATPWFRFYSELLSDRKIGYICDTTGQSKREVIGAWSMVMALASDSPIRGALLLTEQKPLTIKNLVKEMEAPESEVQEVIDAFIEMGMLIHEHGVYYLPNWQKRQFASDSSTERVRQYREQHKEAEPPKETPQETPALSVGNVSETLQSCYSNAPETETETETYTETETETEQKQSRDRDRAERATVVASSNSGGSSASKQALTEGQQAWLMAFGAKRFANNVQREAVASLEATFGTDTLLQGIAWAAKQGLGMGRAITSLETALPKWGKPKRSPPDGNHGHGDGGAERIRIGGL